MISLLGVLACFGAVLGLAAWFVDWTVYRSMTKNHSNKLAHGSFGDFMREFNAHNWEPREQRWRRSFF